MRPGPATQTAFVRGFLLALSPRGGGTTASARQLSIGVPHLLQPVADKRSCDHKPATAAVASKPFSFPAPCSEEQRAANKTGGGGRKARATSLALSRVLWIVPRRFALANHRSPLALPQSFGELRNSHVFDEPTLQQFVAPRNHKNSQPCAETVDDVPSLWKPEEN